MGNSQALMTCGGEAKSKLDELTSRFEDAKDKCNIDELKAIQEEAETWGDIVWDECPDVYPGANAFYDLANECIKVIEECGPPEYKQPVAAFIYDVDPEDGRWTVSFYDQSVSDENDPIIQWTWDFGDGYGHKASNPTHTYDEKGPWVVTLEIETKSGLTDITSEIIELE